MTRVITIFDIIWFLICLCGNLCMAMARSRHSVLCFLVLVCLVTMALTIFLSYRCIQISKLRNPYILDSLSDQSKHLYNGLSTNDAQSTLLRHMPPITMHYMWCRKSHFEFKHYLSILSVAKVLRPDQIIFHYLELPHKDTKGYFTWFDDIQREIAMLTLKPIEHPKLYCSHDFSKGVAKSEDFPTAHGIFMMDDIVITNLTREDYYRSTGVSKLSKPNCEDEVNGVCEKFERRPAQLFLIPSSEPYSLDSGQGRAVFNCPTIEVFNRAGSSNCMQITDGLFPADIWRRNRTFERFARNLAFNNPEPISPLPEPEFAAPKIAHILKFDGESDLSPLCYASIKSAFVKGELEMVFVHGHLDKKSQTNTLWDQLARQFSVTHIPTPGLSQSNSGQQQLLYGMHVLLQYGGILLSCDSLVQRPIEPLLHYPAVSTVVKSIYRILYHHVDFSVVVSRPASRYLQSLIPVLKQLVETGSKQDFGAVAYHVYEQYPSHLHMDLNLVGHLECKADSCLPSRGQLDVRKAYAVKLSWAEGSPPSTLKDLRSLKSLVQPLMQELLDSIVSSAS